MTTRIKLRRDTAANWTLNNPILAAGEPGLETDTGKTKYGDGTTAWTSLSYATGGITAREQIGYFTAAAPELPNNTRSQWFETVVADPDGNAYFVGSTYDTWWTRVVKVDTEGAVLWQKEITWADGNEGQAASAAYNTATDQLVIVAEAMKNNLVGGEQEEGFAVITVNATTGELVGNPTVVRDDVTSDGSGYGFMSPTDIMLTASGTPVVGGIKSGSAVLFNITTQTGSTLDTVFVDSAQFLDRYPDGYNDWYITGTNITSPLGISNVNYYENQPATPLAHTGTGATFVLSDDGAGGYSVVSVAAGGTNYAVGNKITLLGSAFGGSDVTNDATITVSAVDPGGIVTAATVNGTSFSTSPVGGWTATGGTNIASGSNATFTARWRMKGTEIWFPDYAAYFGVSTHQSGSGFVVGDVLELPAANYGGSTTGTITVLGVTDGAIADWAFTGTFNTSTIKLQTAGNNFDFGTEGSWTVQNFDSEAFVWTPDWCVNFGSGDVDEAQALDQDSLGNIYVAARSYDSSKSGGNDRGLLVKISSTGTLVWSKNFDSVEWSSYSDGYTGLVVDSNDDIIVVQDEQITKVDSDGTVLWQKRVEPGMPFNMWNACVDVDSDDNIYWAAEYDFMGSPGDNFLIVKFDTDGNVLWQREAGTTAQENANWNDGFQILTVQGNKFYVAGSFYNGNYDTALGFGLPTDGTGASIDHHGRYLYRETTWTISTSTGTVDVMEIGFQPAQVVAATTNTYSASTVTNDVFELIALRTGDIDGRINDLYSVEFEDGTVQKTAYTGGVAESGASPFIYDTNSYYPTLSDAGKMIRWIANGWNDSVQIYIPSNSEVAFPVGTKLYFMKDDGIQSFMFWNGYGGGDGDVTIMPSSPDSNLLGSVFNSGEGWSVHHPNWDHIPVMVTLTQVSVNRWLLECSSPTQVMDWNW